MNHAIYSADRITHLKIIVVALAAATAMAGIAVCSHVSSNLDADRLIKSGKSVAITSSNLSLTR